MAYSMKRVLINSSLIMSVLIPGIVSAEYILTAPPRESKEAGMKLYGPIAAHLSSILNEKVSYRHPGNWSVYKKDMQKGSFDIVFDGPHFAAWRLDKKLAQPAVKLPGSLSFVLVTPKGLGLQNKQQLVGKRICTLPPPHLGAMTVYSMYPNQMSQPQFTFVKGGMKKLVQTLQAGECEATILRRAFFNKKLPQQQRNDLVVLETSRPYVNQGFTLNARIPAQKRQLIINSFMKDDGKKAAKFLMDRFSENADNFVVANAKDYKELNLLKKNNMFGW